MFRMESVVLHRSSLTTISRQWLHSKVLRAIPLLPVGVFLAGAALLLSDGLLQNYPWVNYDAIVQLLAGRSILRGARLYTDYMDNQPPAVHLFATFTEMVHDQTGLSSPFTYHLAIICLAAWGLWILKRICARMSGANQFVLWASIYVACVFPQLGNQFGEREHLFLVALIPYSVARFYERGDGLPHAWLIALGLFATQKPHFVLVVGLFELAFWRWDALRRKDLVALAAGALAPWAILAIRSPESYKSLVDEVMPYYLQGGYGSVATGLKYFWTSSDMRYGSAGLINVISIVSVAFLLPVFSPRLTRRNRLAALGFIGLGYLALFQQHTFWIHHYLLLYGAGLFGLGASIEAGERKWAVLPTAILLLSVLGVANMRQLSAEMQVQSHNSAAKIRRFAFLPLVDQFKDIVLITPTIWDLPVSFYAKSQQNAPQAAIFQWAHIFLQPHERREELLEPVRKRLLRLIKESDPDLILFSPARIQESDQETTHQALVDDEFRQALKNYHLTMVGPPKLPSFQWHVYSKVKKLSL